jgi:FKBP-type peptidyl-prolyl cis-trans isomerase (trigger factor)
MAKNLEYLREMHSQNVPKEGSSEKEKVLPKLDDEFAKDLSFENLEKMKEVIKENLKAKLEQDSASDLEIQIIDKLLDSIDFEVPETLVNSEKERLMKDADMRIKYMEALQKKENPDNQDSAKAFAESSKNKRQSAFLLDSIGNYINPDSYDMGKFSTIISPYSSGSAENLLKPLSEGQIFLEENASKQAVRQVKAFFILDKIAQDEKIYLKEGEIEKYIEGLAAQYKKTKDEIRGYLEKGHGMDELAVNMRNKKVMEFLVKEAKIE